MGAAQQGTDSQGGFTLIELVMAIVIISLALLGVIQVIIVTTTHSADAVVDRQALAIAEAYLEEILLKDFSDPGGGAESGRADYDDVGDYNGLLDPGARDQSDTAITGLADYTVTVSVVAAALGSVPPGQAMMVTVSVSHPNGINLSLVGYKTNY
jgi:MSHA pilin protein MshD